MSKRFLPGSTGISIHAPTRGATAGILFIPSVEYFNPRSHKGSDADKQQWYAYAVQFQSTLPQGERRDGDEERTQRIIFQSTLPQGERRYQILPGDEVDIISIHAPTRGATARMKKETMAPTKFQSTLPQGERRSYYD